MAGVRPNTERLPPDHEPVAGRAGPNYHAECAQREFESDSYRLAQSYVRRVAGGSEQEDTAAAERGDRLDPRPGEDALVAIKIGRPMRNLAGVDPRGEPWPALDRSVPCVFRDIAETSFNFHLKAAG
jgi:hypothetical protein